jgi:hypothetical protein
MLQFRQAQIKELIMDKMEEYVSSEISHICKALSHSEKLGEHTLDWGAQCKVVTVHVLAF